MSEFDFSDPRLSAQIRGYLICLKSILSAAQETFNLRQRMLGFVQVLGGVIPPDATLIFIVELIGVEPAQILKELSANVRDISLLK